LRLEDAPLDRFTLQPTQEKETLKKEWIAILVRAVPKLTTREQKFLDLIAQGLSAKEIARRLKMAKVSVYQRKHALLSKLRRLVGEGENK
jgi:DNA-binding NarL/FixJ family response regulator